MSRTSFSLLAAAVTVGGLFLVVWIGSLLRTRFGARTRLVALLLLGLYALTLVLRPTPWPIIDVAVILGAVGGALLLEKTLGAPGAVGAFLVAAAVFDLVSMSGGLTRALIDGYRDGSNNFLLYLTLAVPVRGRAVPIVGIGDLLVGGAAALALLRMSYRPLLVMATVAIGILAALAYGLWRGGAPAIPFIAAAVLIMLYRRK